MICCATCQSVRVGRDVCMLSVRGSSTSNTPPISYVFANTGLAKRTKATILLASTSEIYGGETASVLLARSHQNI